jgi:hypothetical protein
MIVGPGEKGQVLHRDIGIWPILENVTRDRWRHGLHMSFVLGWLTPEEASPIGVPWEIARNCSPRVQRMLGYASSRPGEDQAPLNWLIDFVDVRSHLGIPVAAPTVASGLFDPEWLPTAVVPR